MRQFIGGFALGAVLFALRFGVNTGKIRESLLFSIVTAIAVILLWP